MMIKRGERAERLSVQREALCLFINFRNKSLENYSREFGANGSYCFPLRELMSSQRLNGKHRNREVEFDSSFAHTKTQNTYFF